MCGLSESLHPFLKSAEVDNPDNYRGIAITSAVVSSLTYS